MKAFNNKKKEEERWGLILNLVSARYQLEWQRMSELNSKAGNLITFDGVIISILAIFTSIVHIDITSSVSYIFLSSIILLLISIICSLKAYTLKRISYVPSAKSLLKNYSKAYFTQKEVYEEISIMFKKAIDGQEATEEEEKITGNMELNNKRAKWVNTGLIFLVIGIFMVSIFISLLFFNIKW